MARSGSEFDVWFQRMAIRNAILWFHLGNQLEFHTRSMIAQGGWLHMEKISDKSEQLHLEMIKCPNAWLNDQIHFERSSSNVLRTHL